MRPNPDQPGAPARDAPPNRQRWLLFVHQLPSHPSNLRVRTWRRLQQLGAIPIKQAVYLLPDTPDTREDFEWLKAEVKEAGGEASVFAAGSVDAWSDDTLIEEFRRSRQAAYGALARDVEKAVDRESKAKGPRGVRGQAVRRQLEIFRERFAAIESVDFFGSAGRDRVVTLLKRLDEKTADKRAGAADGVAAGDRTAYQRRLWVTRPRPGVDRMASAWLIRRFIDPRARFAFAATREAAPDDAVPFDMFGVDLSHHGDSCTFETLCGRFGIDEPAIARIAGIVHDLDLKDARFGAPEAATIGALIDGLQLAFAEDEDDALLEQGMTLFESLHRSFERSERSIGPRPLARPGKRTSSSRKPTDRTAK